MKHWFLRGFLSATPSCPLGKSHDDHSGMLGIHKEERGVKTEPYSSGKVLAFYEPVPHHDPHALGRMSFTRSCNKHSQWVSSGDTVTSVLEAKVLGLLTGTLDSIAE